MKNGPKIKANPSNTIYFVLPFTFHHLKIRFNSPSINKTHEQNNVTGINFLNDLLGKKANVIVHKTTVFPILKKITMKDTTPSFSLVFETWSVLFT